MNVQDHFQMIPKQNKQGGMHMFNGQIKEDYEVATHRSENEGQTKINNLDGIANMVVQREEDWDYWQLNLIQAQEKGNIVQSAKQIK